MAELWKITLQTVTWSDHKLMDLASYLKVWILHNKTAAV